MSIEGIEEVQKRVYRRRVIPKGIHRVKFSFGESEGQKGGMDYRDTVSLRDCMMYKMRDE